MTAFSKAWKIVKNECPRCGQDGGALECRSCAEVDSDPDERAYRETGMSFNERETAKRKAKEKKDREGSE